VEIQWSYSSINLFKQCPKKYYHLRVAKDIQDKQSEALIYGNRVHKAAEEYVKQGVDIPPPFAYIKEPIDKLLDMHTGEVHCELRLGLTEELKPCTFFAADVWYRGVIDLLIIDEGGEKATLVDYKTGKTSKWADTNQLEIMSLAIFKHFPKIKKIKAGLLYLVNPALIKASYRADQQDDLWVKWVTDVETLRACYNNAIWNANPNFTCAKWCPVTSCVHNGKT